MHVAYVCADPGIPVWGTKGASVHVQAVVRVLVRAGAEVDLVCARSGSAPPPDLAGVRVHHLPAVRGDHARQRERSAVAADAAVPELLRSVHRRRPLDLVYERYSLWGRAATAWATTHRVHSLLEVNAPLVDEQARHRELADRGEAEQVARSAIGRADATICVTDEVASWARDRAAEPARVHVVANGVDTRTVTPTGRPVTPATGPFTVGFVGTLKAWHGVETLLDATAALVAEDPAYRLLLVGTGPRAQALAARSEELGIGDHVEWTGAVPAAAVPELLQRMDLAAAPYPPVEDFYFSPLKVYEYLAAGLPVVASRIGVLPDLLQEGRLGALVEPGSAEELAVAVRDLRADVRRRRRLRELTVTAAAGHDWTHVVTRTLGLVGLRLEGAGRAVA